MNPNDEVGWPYGWTRAGNLWARAMKVEDVRVKTSLLVMEIVLREAGGQSTRLSSKVDGADYYEFDISTQKLGKITVGITTRPTTSSVTECQELGYRCYIRGLKSIAERAHGAIDDVRNQSVA